MAVHPNDKYGRLIVLRRGEDYLYRGQKQPRWVCKCACGNEILVRACHLLSGNTQSCGCLRRTRNQSRPHKVQYVFHNDYVECRLTNGISFLIDLSDYARVCLYGWSYNRPRDYVFCNAAHMKQIPLSRFLLNCPHDMEVDHINHNRLDNRRCNLRIASKSQNRANRRPGKNSTTGYIGVSYCKQTKKWRASIVGANGNTTTIGRFASIETAAIARDVAAYREYGSFAWLNFPARLHEYAASAALGQAPALPRGARKSQNERPHIAGPPLRVNFRAFKWAYRPFILPIDTKILCPALYGR